MAKPFANNGHPDQTPETICMNCQNLFSGKIKKKKNKKNKILSAELLASMLLKRSMVTVCDLIYPFMPSVPKKGH